MRLVAIILALFVAFPNMGYALTSNCCSHEEAKQDSCHEDVLDLCGESQDSEEKKDSSCPGQCDCSCCMHTFLIKDVTKESSNLESTLSNSSPLSPETPFRLGFYNLIWQPPQLG